MKSKPRAEEIKGDEELGTERQISDQIFASKPGFKLPYFKSIEI